MEYIKIDEKDYAFRFGLRALKKLETSVGQELFEKVINGVAPTFGESIKLAEAILLIGLQEGAKKEGDKSPFNKAQVEDILDDKGMDFLGDVMELFGKAVSSPK
jgi:hypothetical protein